MLAEGAVCAQDEGSEAEGTYAGWLGRGCRVGLLGSVRQGVGTERPVHQDEVWDFFKLEDTEGPKWRWHGTVLGKSRRMN